MTIVFAEAAMRKELNDPAFEMATIQYEFETDRYVLTFSSNSLIEDGSLLMTARGKNRKFKTIDAANAVAEKLGFSKVIIDNRLECLI
jgi:hypothetical protein